MPGYALRPRSSLAAGWTLAGGTALLLGALLGDPWLLACGTPLLAAVPLCRWWVGRALRGITVHLSVDRRRLFAGDPVRLQLTLAYRSRLPLGHVVTAAVFRAAVETTAAGPGPRPRVVEHGQGMTALVDTWVPRSRLRLHRSYHLALPRRGIARIDRIEVTARDPLGLFEARYTAAQPLSLVVYPAPTVPRRLPSSDRLPGGSRVVADWLWPDPTLYAGARPYRPGDPLRWLDWRATARRRALQVKIFDSSRQPTAVVLVDLRTYDRAWDGVRSAEAEGLLAAAAGLLLELDAQRCRTLLVTNMARLLTAARQRPPGTLEAQLEELAAADLHGTAPAAAMAPLLDRLEADTVLVCSPLRDPSLAAVLRVAARRRRRLHLFGGMPAPPPWVHEACSPDAYTWLGVLAQ